MKFKKWILSFLIVCMSAVLVGALAACGEPSYYDITFQEVAGVRYVIEGGLMSGAQVKEGYTVRFSLDISEEATGEPTVTANDTELSPDGNGVYSFVMEDDTTVAVSGVYVTNAYTVTFDAGSNFVWFYNEEGEPLTVLRDVPAGEEIAFSVKVSIYYAVAETGDYKVVANTGFLDRSADGLYRMNVTGNVTVSVREIDESGNAVTELSMAENFTERADGGSGTASDPYLIREPVDLYMMSVLVNDGEFSRYGFNTAHYRLEQDIDMQGEQIYVIGDGSSQNTNSVFGGVFDGNGHTISDYVISATYYNREYGADVVITNVGLFGIVMPVSGVPEIYNLRLEDFTIEADCSASQSVIYVGGIVGYGIGLNLTGCSVSGSINAIADSNGSFGYIGGVIGLLQSAYDAETETSTLASVRSTASDVEVVGELNYFLAAGGIAGAVLSYVPSTTAFILNSYSTGAVSGAIRTGGIAGMLFANSSVLSCYSTGSVEAKSEYTDDLQATAYSHAYAGGIAGYAENDVIIADCFSASALYAQASSGASYGHTSDILGGSAEESEYPGYDNCAPLVRNSVHTRTVSVTDTYIESTLGWSDADWTFSGNGRPAINHSATEKTFTITLNFGSKTVDGASQKTVQATAYVPMAYWYLFMRTGGVPQYVAASDGTRSYGYFFGSDFAEKVPYAYVPTNDVTLYADFANYGDVAGTYYLRGTGTPAKGISVTLGTDGTLTYRNGAMESISNYYYDGETVTLVETPVGIHAAGQGASSVNYQNFRATLADGILTIEGKMQDASTGQYTAITPLLAQKEFANFAYGEYQKGDTTYVFYKDGTGYCVISDARDTFTYTVSGSAITLRLSGGTERTGTVEGGRVTAIGSVTELATIDEFAGTWEKASNLHTEYTFDGYGTWKFVRYQYLDGHRNEIETKQGSYTMMTGSPDGKRYLQFENEGEVHAYFEDGFLTVEKAGVKDVYYKQGSFVGSWVFKSRTEQLRLNLGGIGQDGFGRATVVYTGQASATFDLTYETADGTLLFYLGDMPFGNLSFSESGRTLNGSFFSYRDNVMTGRRTFLLYDEYRGTWIGSEEGFELAEFNGEGSYRLDADEYNLAASGRLTIGDTVVLYTLDNGTMKGSFVYNNITYTIEYIEEENCIRVTYDKSGSGQQTFELHRRDAWYSLGLIDNEGHTYTFDGKGNLDEGGTLTFYNGVSYANWTYKVQADGSIAISGSVTGSIVVEENHYKITRDGSEYTAYINAGFKGTWRISGEFSDLVVGDIGADMKATGSVTLGGESHELNYTYNAEGNYLSFELEETVYYLNIARSGTEITMGTVNSFSGTVCIRSDRVDDFSGVWDGPGGATLHFDGLGRSVYSYGIAYTADSEGRELQRYYYRLDEKGVPALRRYGAVSLQAERIFVAKTDGAYTKQGGDGKTYELIAPDAAYGGKVLTYNEVTYYFDGSGTVTRTARGIEQKFTYTCTSSDFTVTVEITLDGPSKETVTLAVDSFGNRSIRSAETASSVL